MAILGGPSDAAAKLANVAARHNRVALVDELAPAGTAPRDAASWRRASRPPHPTSHSWASALLVRSSWPTSSRRSSQAPSSAVARPWRSWPAFGRGRPSWVQRLGMEWAFRLAIEPRRLARRYLLAGFTFTRLLGAHVGAPDGVTLLKAS